MAVCPHPAEMRVVLTELTVTCPALLAGLAVQQKSEEFTVISKNIFDILTCVILKQFFEFALSRFAHCTS